MKTLHFLIRAARPEDQPKRWDQWLPILQSLKRRLPESNPTWTTAGLPLRRLSLSDVPLGRPGDLVTGDVSSDFIEVSVRPDVGTAEALETVRESCRDVGRETFRVDLVEV